MCRKEDEMTPFASLIESQLQRTESLRTQAAQERALNEHRPASGLRTNLAYGLRTIARHLDPERGTVHPA